MQLYLVRHAQSENNARAQSQRIDDPALTRIGHEQAKRLGMRAAQLQLNRIVTSPFLRALQTARHIEEASGLAPEVRVALHEKGGCLASTDTGDWTGRPGMTRREIEARFPTYHVASEIDGQGWWGSKPLETLDRARRRAHQLLADASAEFDDEERVAFVMHGDFMMLLVACFHTQPVNLAWNASLSRVSISESTTTLEEYSRVDHLPNYLVTW